MLACEAVISGNGIRNGVHSDMTHVQCTTWIGKHGQHVKLAVALCCFSRLRLLMGGHDFFGKRVFDPPMVVSCLLGSFTRTNEWS